MVKPVAKAEVSSFVKGFVTEASPLNFPSDASRDEENYELNKDGSRDRRLGIDFENSYTLRDTGFTAEELVTVAVSSYRWNSAGGDPTNEFEVIQFGDKVDIYDSSKESISTDGYLGSVTLIGVDSTIRFSYSSVDGILVIAASTEEIHIIEWDGASFSYSTNRILVRDLWGLPDTEHNDINLRPTALTDAHLYNLRNQSWGIPRKKTASLMVDPISTFYDEYLSYPSNAETVYTGLFFKPVIEGTPYERFYVTRFNESLGVDLPAAKGYFIIDALRRGTSRASVYADNMTKFSTLTLNISSLPSDITQGGASVVADFAGRIFFGGFNGEVIDGDANSPNLSSYIFFSQLVKNKEDIIKCYQWGDPTSRENTDIVDTDGGFIRISGAKKIYGFATLAANLFVLADNGVWQIQGGSDYGFTATNYSVGKLSDYGCSNTDSIITVNDQIFFWGDTGIFSISRNQYGDWVVTSLTEKTIQSFYDSISTESKRNAVGIYDAFDKKIRWIYDQDTDRANETVVREIILDLQLGSYSKTRIYNLESDTPEVIGFIRSASFLTGDTFEEIVVGGVPVVVGLDEVGITVSSRTSGIQSIKYITLHSTVGGNVGYSFAQYKDIDFVDWKSVDNVGVDAKGFILTGVLLAGDSSVFKQTPYLIAHFRRTEDGVESVGGQLVPTNQSSCKIRSQWDWANNTNSGKWSPLFEAYRYRRPYFITDISDTYDNGFEVVTTKNKLRGRGRAFSMYLETSPGKDCRILGWNLSLTGNNLT